MNHEPAPSRLHPSIVLSAYLEPVVRGRRVAVLGDATSGLAELVAERGARLLHVYDPDPARVAEALARLAPGAPSAITFATLSGDPGVRDGAFDVVIAPDLSLFADPADAMRRARRLVPPSGVALFGVPNAARSRPLLRDDAARPASPRALGYYELFDLVSLQFAKVRMVGQIPFVGYTVADFAPNGEPDVSIDTSLVGTSEEPDHFLAIASDRPVSVEAYAVVALPWKDVAAARGDEAREAGRFEAGAAAANLEVAIELDKARALAASEAEGRAAAVARVAELEGQAPQRDTKLKEAEARAGDNHVRAERLSNQIRDLEEELVRQRDRATKLSRQLDEEKRARTKAELELGMLRNKPETPGTKERIDALSAELEASRSRVAELELEQVKTHRRPEPHPDAKLAHQVSELEHAVDDALREAAKAAEQRDASDERAKQLEARIKTADAAASVAAREVAKSTERAVEIEGRLAARDAELAAHAAAVATLQAELAAARKKASEADDAVRSTDAASAEVTALENALRERGSVVTQLRRDLAESERIGKELVGELEAATAASTNGANGTGGTGGGESPRETDEELRGRLDTLAVSAARSQADLQAATWRITLLERELSESKGAVAEPSAVQIELEQALAAARDEVASLRRAVHGTSS